MTVDGQPLPRDGRGAACSAGWSVVVALWLAIAVALLSALPSGGLIASKTIGSAFDPTTTGVVLRARSQHDVITAVRIRDRSPVPAHEGPTASLIAIPALPALAPIPEARLFATAAVPLSSRRRAPAQARAPPIA